MAKHKENANKEARGGMNKEILLEAVLRATKLWAENQPESVVKGKITKEFPLLSSAQLEILLRAVRSLYQLRTTLTITASNS